MTSPRIIFSSAAASVADVKASRATTHWFWSGCDNPGPHAARIASKTRPMS
jgi:hypothetical protein